MPGDPYRFARLFRVRPRWIAGASIVASAAAALISAGCDAPESGESSEKGGDERAIGSVAEPLVGKDGAFTVTAANTILNQYAVLAADAAAGATSVTVTNVTDLTSAQFGPIEKGDLVMIYQAQGADIVTSNNIQYGSVSALNNAGRYEVVSVTGVAGNTLSIDTSCAGLKNSYTAAGHVQVVRIPQLTNLTVNAAASVVASAWDGARGGIVALHLTGTATLNGPIDVSARGFRGGAIDNQSSTVPNDITTFRSANNTDGAEKGEGIAGDQVRYDALNGRFGRGAPANGGGGGNGHNAGGGGGANGNVGTAWTGQGVMDPGLGNIWLNAWQLDPAFAANGNMLTASSGGGRGGYTYSGNEANALTVAPGSNLWGGDLRKERGGLGGRPLANDAAARLFFGGGGGAGDGNNQSAGAGGRGGGLAFVIANAIGGGSKIMANGAVGQNTTTAGGAQGNDAPGGGGAGGSVVLFVPGAITGITVEAIGGAGGNQNILFGPEGEGPAGGGSGGFVAMFQGGAAVLPTITGGSHGTTNSTALTEFLPNGATRGAAGNAVSGMPNLAAVAVCIDTTAPDTTIVTQPANPTNDNTGDFTFTSNDAAATFECSLDGGVFAPCNAAFTTAALADGSHTLQVRAVDPVGNTDPTPASYTWVVDTAPPDTSIVTQPTNPTNDNTGDFTFSSNDPTATFECSIDGGAFAPCTASYTTPILVDGQHTITVRAKDPAGNVDPTPASYTWNIDTGAPDTLIVTHPNDPTNDNTGDFTFGSNDPAATYLCSVDGGPFLPCEAAFTTMPLADGVHTIQVAATDQAGNTDATPASFTWTVDTAPPDTTIQTQPTNPTNDNTGDFTFSSNEMNVTYMCSVDGGAFVPCGPSFTTGALADGSHTLAVQAVDAAGNADPTPATTTWVVDTAPPDTTILTQPTNPTNDSTGDFTFGANEMPVTFECSIDGGPFVPCSQAFSTMPLADGSHTLAVRAVDQAGNTDPTPATYTWTVTSDADGDGLGLDQEILLGTDPNDADSDDDGVLDGAEPSAGADSDGDGVINALDPDSDNDGILDGTELGLDCSNPDSGPTCVPDVDGGISTTDPLDPDTDDGGISDGVEDANHNGVIDGAETDPNDPADDMGPNDPDGDGLTNNEEATIGTDPNDADSDDDGVLDGAEPDPGVDSDGDGLINALDVDSDNDALQDGTELGAQCTHPDTDATICVGDADPSTTTDPLDADTDDGGVTDGGEDVNGDGLQDPGETDPTAGHGADDTANVDTDGDGLSDEQETALGTDPEDADSDDDGVIDGEEPNPGEDTDGDGAINALDQDSDDDGLLDGTELGKDCSNPATDPANGCVADADGGATTTSPLLPDTDGGSVSDGDEDTNHNGQIDAGEKDPNDPADDNPNLDLDGDGLTNQEETDLGTDPTDADSDDDGVIDGDEPDLDQDTDGDGTINALDPDSDNDGLFDGTELGLGCDDPDTDVAAGNCTADADEGATTTDPLNKDTDGGSVSDGDEDANHNGQIDPEETDPNDKADDIPTPEECTTDADCGGPDSGLVCDLDFTCIQGCRGKDGNSCPDELVCTSEDQTIGKCETPEPGDDVIATGSGVFCALPAGPAESPSPILTLIGLAAAAAAIRRRR